MVFPADTFQEATEIAIEASNQLHGVINGDANAEVTVEDGSKIPSVRKAMVDSLYFKPPIAWAQGEYEDTYNQLREFVDGDVRTWWFAKGATVSTPVLMTTNPATDPNWTLWSAVTLNAATYETQKRLAAEAGLNMVGSFLLGGTVTNVGGVVFYETDGKYYGWGGALPKTVTVGSTPATAGGVGVGLWSDKTDLMLRGEVYRDDTTVTVGGTGDFQTINDAIVFLSKTIPYMVVNSNDSAQRYTVNILSGYTAQEQININGLNLGWIDITSEDAEVIIDRASLSTKVGRWYSFIRCKNGTTPNIKTLFNMNSTGASTERVGLYLINSASFIEPYAGFKNSGERNVDCTQGSILCAASGIFTGAGNVGVRPATGSIAFLQFADVSNCSTGMSCGSGASVAAENLTAQNCSVTSVEVQGGVSIELDGSNLSGFGSYGIYARGACTVNASNVIMSSGNGYGVYAKDGASVTVNSAAISGLTGTAGIFAIYGGVISGSLATVTGCPINVMATKGGLISIDSSTLTGGVSYGLYASEAGIVNATNSQYRKTVGVDATTDARVASSGVMNLFGSTGGSYQTVGVTTTAGVIVKSTVASTRGSSTITAGALSVTVAHNLPSAPIVTLTQRAALTTAQCWVANVTTTTFDIVISAAQGSNISFFWNADLN